MVTSNVDAVYDSHVGNHARFVSHDVVNLLVYGALNTIIDANAYNVPVSESPDDN